MYRFNFTFLFNRLVTFVLIFSLSVLSFSFTTDENVKQEINTLYNATSISEYYNSITNFSYTLINKILESANVVLTEKSSKKRNDNKQNKTTKEKLDFVKLNSEKEIKFLNNHSSVFYNILFDTYTFFYDLAINVVPNLYDFNSFYIKTNCCYFARGNIENIININNIAIENRLV